MLCRHYMVRSAQAKSIVQDSATLGEALALMIKHHMQQLLVVNAKGEYVGELTTFTLAKLLLPGGSNSQSLAEAEAETVGDVDERIMPYLHRKVADFVDHDLPLMHPDSPLTEAVRLLAAGRLRLPVVEQDSKQFIGVISPLTVLRRYQF